MIFQITKRMVKFKKGDNDIKRFNKALLKESIRILLFFQKGKSEDEELFMNYIIDIPFEIKIINIKSEDKNLKFKNYIPDEIKNNEVC